MEIPFLTIDQFKIMDQKAIHEYAIPIELMMENSYFKWASYDHDKKQLGPSNKVI